VGTEMNNINRCDLVATSPEATWHLVRALENGGGGVVSTHNGCLESFAWALARSNWARGSEHGSGIRKRRGWGCEHSRGSL
jgi:hypothetical protein